MKKIEIIEAVKENNLFDLVAKRGHEMEKRDLLIIIKELEYAVYDNLTERVRPLYFLYRYKSLKISIRNSELSEYSEYNKLVDIDLYTCYNEL